AVRLDEDHLSIAKPRSRDSQVYMAASDILRNYVLFSPATRQLMQREPEVAVVGTAPRHLNLHIKVETPINKSDQVRIPHELPETAKNFKGRKIELEHLIDRLRRRQSTAVVGPAGLGKTALAAAALIEVAGETRGAVATNPYPDGIVFLNLYTLHGDGEAAWT